MSADTAAARSRTEAVPAEALDLFAETIRARFGHHMELARRDELQALLGRRMAATRSRTFAAYSALLAAEAGRAEWEALAPLLTVPETYFFRMPAHFDTLVEDVLPEVLERKAGRRTLRFLSAGCATGEECYTLRMLLDERFPTLAADGWKVEIVGVDLSQAALERARAGVYSEWSLRGTSQVRRERFFTRQNGRPVQYRIGSAARTGVVFRRENLLAALPEGEGCFDVVFCRNVLIYFTDEAIRVAIARLAERLGPGGYLFLGPAESLRGVSGAFELCQGRDTFFYRLRDPAAARNLSAAKLDQRAAAAPAFDPAAPAPADESWYASIAESWQRLHRLTSGPAAAVRRKGTPPHGSAEEPASAAAPGGDAPGELHALFAAERFADALDLLERLRRHADSGNLRLARAAALHSLSRHPEAEAEARALIAEGMVEADAQYLLGLCREQAGALPEAADALAAAAYLDPGFSMAHLHRGLLARRQGDAPAARAAFAQALRTLEAAEPASAPADVWREDAAAGAREARRMALFAGGFSRASLRALCLRELRGEVPA